MQELRRAGKKALIPFLTAGFPSLAEFPSLLAEVSRIGDLVEIGVPFSDPLADGPVIQQTSQRALQQGATLLWILKTIAEPNLHRQIEAPLILMSYLNPLLQCQRSAVSSQQSALMLQKVQRAGVSGMIIPDLPVDEGEPFERLAASYDIDLIYLLAPTTSVPRARLIAERSRGVVYLVSITGVTGARDRFSEDMVEFLKRIRALTDKPLCVGFGISRPEHVAQVAPHVDGIIVGSALLRVIIENPTDCINKAKEFLLELKQSLVAGR
jgi:tryptophan synthase alpha chain